MPVYLIVEAWEIKDEKKYAEYGRRVPGLIAAFGGRYLARGGKVEVLSGPRRPRRVVVVEFPSREALRAWWNSAEYREIAHLREESASISAVVVEGCGGQWPC